MTLVGDLTQLANQCQPLIGELRAGEPISATLLHPDLTLLTEVEALLNLTFLTKDARFADTFLEEPDLEQRLDDPQPSTGEVPLVSPGQAPIGSVTGRLGQLAGSAKLPIQTEAGISVTWSVHGERGVELVEGEDFLAPDGLSALEVSFVLPPVSPDDGGVQELTVDPQSGGETNLFVIRATVTVSAFGESVSVALPDVEVAVPPLRVPTMLALFRNRTFAAVGEDEPGVVLVVVPSNSPVTIADFDERLAELRSAAEALGSLNLTESFGFAAFALGLQQLSGNLAQHQFVKLVAADEIDRLNQIVLAPFGGGLLAPAVEAAQEMSSLIFVGPPERVVHCFNGVDQNPPLGQLDVTIGPELVTTIADLHSSDPETHPTERSEVINDATFGTFGNSFSSLAFEPFG